MTQLNNDRACPVCNGEKQVGYRSSDNSKPPELGDCYRCNGTGRVDGEATQETGK